jgi:threonine 3-dehydrogenase
MVHACARKQPYASFASPEVKIPFMAMPDAVTALIQLSKACRSTLTRSSYNVTAFSVTVEDIRRQLLRDFPDAAIAYAPDARREQILHSWPAELNDSAARADWGWRPAYSFVSSFREYLIPGVTRKYC